MADRFALLAACCVPASDETADAGVRAAAKNEHDWARVLEAAGEHGIRPLVCHRVLASAGDLLEPDAVGLLAAAARVSAARALASVQQLATVVTVLQRAGVPVLPYKGPALAIDAYANAALRESDDLDIVVEPMRVAAAAAALAAAEYMPFGSNGTRADAWPEARRAHDWQGHVPLRGVGRSLPVELHWRFCDRKLPWSPDIRSILARAGRRDIGGVSMPLPDASDQLSLVLLHAARHGWDRLEGLACAAALIGRGIDVPTFLARAFEVGGQRAALAGLELARLVLGIPLPAALVTAIRADAAISGLVDRAERRLRAGDAGERRDARLHLASLDTLGARGRYIALHLALPTPRDRALIRLPRSLEPLYVAVRVARLAGRALTG